MEQVEFNTQDFCINAGIVGLFTMIENNDDKRVCEIKESTLKIDKEYMLNTDFAELYFNALINKYKNNSPLTKTIIKLESLLEKDLDQKELKEELKVIETALNSNRYKSGYEIVKNKLPFDWNNDLQNLKKSTTDNYKDNIKIILNDLENNDLKEIFLIKDVSYFIVNNFWEDVSFLNTSNSKKDPKEEFRKYFEKPLKDYLSKEAKENEFCAECGSRISGNSKIKSSYVHTLAEDFARKNSNYWNFKPNCYICPKCNFLFSLIPLGFSSYKNSFIFINQNDSVNTLIKTNDDIFSNDDLQSYQKFNEMINKITEKNLEKLSNIEVITNLGNKQDYDFNIISRNILLKIKYNFKRLEYLSKKSAIKTREGYLNVYDETMRRILSNYSLYSLINDLMLLSLDDETKSASSSCYTLLKIEGGVKMQYENIIEIGKKYRKELNNENKVKELVFQMLDMIKMEKADDLFDLIANLSNITGEKLPEELYEILTDNEKLKLIGYAFVIGFRNGDGINE